MFFRRLNLPVPPIVAYGIEGRRGALITEEVANTTDLAELAQQRAPQLENRAWVSAVSDQVAKAAQQMHRHNFAHNELKWRNILVDSGERPAICLIDCPSGRFWKKPFLEYRIIKDLACLDKVAKYQLSVRQRLQFYRTYTGRARLSSGDKKRLKKIQAFFRGRE